MKKLVILSGVLLLLTALNAISNRVWERLHKGLQQPAQPPVEAVQPPTVTSTTTQISPIVNLPEPTISAPETNGVIVVTGYVTPVYE